MEMHFVISPVLLQLLSKHHGPPRSPQDVQGQTEVLGFSCGATRKRGGGRRIG